MGYQLNSTEDYHRFRISSLGWELTVCNTIDDPRSPARKILRYNAAYGEMLFLFLATHLDWRKITHIMEIGGGYGFLMRALLKRAKPRCVTMLDISPFLIGKQKENLEGFDIKYIEGDFLAYNLDGIALPDLMIFNENLGDFPTLIDINRRALEDCPNDGSLLARAKTICEIYRLPVPDGKFNFNIGALLALEKSCAALTPHIFIAEHSCEARAPSEYSRFLNISAGGNPWKISLLGHDEYTIKLSHLTTIALAHGYKSTRGPLADILPPKLDEQFESVLSRAPQSDGDEIIQHFFRICLNMNIFC